MHTARHPFFWMLFTLTLALSFLDACGPTQSTETPGTEPKRELQQDATTSDVQSETTPQDTPSPQDTNAPDIPKPDTPAPKDTPTPDADKPDVPVVRDTPPDTRSPDVPPVTSFKITTTPPKGQVCQGYLQALVAAEGSNKGYRWEVTKGALPDGLKLSTVGTPQAYLSGSPLRAGTFSFTLRVTDELGTQASKAISLQVSESTTLLYVDKQIPSATCATYNPANRTCTGGTQRAYKTIKGAADLAKPGDTVLFRAGTYTNEQLVPKQSGKAGQCIVYRNYQKEAVVITGSKYPGIDISNRDHLVIEGLQVSNIRRWLYGVKASYNIIRNNKFLNANDSGGSSKTGLFFQEATYNKILGNTIDQSTQDNLALIKSDRNLVEGNTFRNAKHVLWVIKCGNNNIIQGNSFDNRLQKIGEIYDCDGVGFNHEFDVLNATKYNVVHGNTFEYTPSSGDASPYAGIQYAGQNGIIRRNRFYNTLGPGLDHTLYSKEAQYNTNNRIYHNVFSRTRFAGISLAAGNTFKDNVFKNNILTGSVFQQNDKRWAWYKHLDGKPTQLITGRTDGFFFERNNFFHQKAGEKYLITNGRRDRSTAATPQYPLSWWEQNHPALFAKNLEKDPGFVDAAKYDFHLKSSSPMINEGVALTTAAGTAQGKTLAVKDAGYFHDGYKIPGVVGDIIQILGSNQTARVVSIDRGRHILTLDRALSWKDGDGISLAHYGTKPDLGAHEFHR